MKQRILKLDEYISERLVTGQDIGSPEIFKKLEKMIINDSYISKKISSTSFFDENGDATQYRIMLKTGETVRLTKWDDNQWVLRVGTPGDFIYNFINPMGDVNVTKYTMTSAKTIGKPFAMQNVKDIFAALKLYIESKDAITEGNDEKLYTL